MAAYHVCITYLACAILKSLCFDFMYWSKLENFCCFAVVFLCVFNAGALAPISWCAYCNCWIFYIIPSANIDSSMALSDAAYVDAKCKKDVHVGYISWRQIVIVIVIVYVAIKSSKMPIDRGIVEYDKSASVRISLKIIQLVILCLNEEIHW